jgi:hypothetical protein
MLHKLMIFILAHIFEGIRLCTVIVLAFLAGELVEITDTANKNPALTSILAGIIIALGVRFVEKWLEGRNKTIKTADKVLELEHEDKKELRTQHAKLMAEKEAWWIKQNDRLKADLFEVRTRSRADRLEADQINHSAINELMRLQNIILGMQRSLVMNHIEVPEVAHLDLTKFMLPAWELERDEQDEHQERQAADNDQPVP